MITRIFLAILFFLFIENTFSQQVYITGHVVDGESQQPLKGASVYINSTTKGSVTDDNGDFELGPLQPGQYDVIASFVGYDPLLYSAKLNTTNLRISFKLEKKEIVMREVLILTDQTRKHYLDILKKNLLGYSVAADHCTIKNIEEVQFATGENKDEIIAYTEKELQIENPVLGYTIYFELIDFYYNKATSATYFLGYTRFTDWGNDEKTKKKWLRKRRQSYEGSTIHFFRSLVNKQLAKEGFSAYQLTTMKKSKTDTATQNGTFTMNTPAKQGMQIASRTIEDSMIRLYPDSVYRIYELRVRDGWRINFARSSKLKEEITSKMLINGQPPSGTISGLRVREEPVLVNEKGILLTPIRVFYDGMWSFERLANMLPEDYEVE